jgi:hypothetical protein
LGLEYFDSLPLYKQIHFLDTINIYDKLSSENDLYKELKRFRIQNLDIFENTSMNNTFFSEFQTIVLGEIHRNIDDKFLNPDLKTKLKQRPKELINSNEITLKDEIEKEINYYTPNEIKRIILTNAMFKKRPQFLRTLEIETLKKMFKTYSQSNVMYPMNRRIENNLTNFLTRIRNKIHDTIEWKDLNNLHNDISIDPSLIKNQQYIFTYIFEGVNKQYNDNYIVSYYNDESTLLISKISTFLDNMFMNVIKKVLYYMNIISICMKYNVNEKFPILHDIIPNIDDYFKRSITDMKEFKTVFIEELIDALDSEIPTNFLNAGAVPQFGTSDFRLIQIEINTPFEPDEKERELAINNYRKEYISLGLYQIQSLQDIEDFLSFEVKNTLTNFLEDYIFFDQDDKEIHVYTYNKDITRTRYLCPKNVSVPLYCYH